MKRRWKEKEMPSLAEALLKERIEYPQLYYADSLYAERLTLLRSNEFKAFMRKAARQLSPLLSINQRQFFKVIAQNISIRTSLQSGLATFPRRAYSRYVDSRSKQHKKIESIKDESFQIYSFLMKIVLAIFYRISSAQHTEDKQLTYNEFLLDIPKLLDVAAIYGQSNPQIVRKLIENAYNLSPDYDRDTLDFFNCVEKGKFQEMQRNQSTFIDFSPQSLSAQNFGNRQKYMIEKTMLTIFTVKDILFNLTNFFLYFPKRYAYELASDYKLQQKLVDGVTFFMNQVDNQWKLGDYRQRYFTLHFEDLRQSMAIYFITEFKLLREIIEDGNKDTQQYLQSAHNTYQTFCHMLKFKKKRYHKQYQKLINILIEQSQDIIFFLNGTKIYNSINKTKAAVDFCQEYQKVYRGRHKLGKIIDFDPILNKNRDNLKKFKEVWVDKTTEKRNMIAKEMQQKYKRTEDHQLYAYINKLKYGGKQKQYDDQPEQQEFNQIQLPNEYVKMEKKLENLSFVMNTKRHYMLKSSIRQEQLDFSYSFAAKQKDIGSLSFSQIENVSSTQESNLSIVYKQQNMLFFDLDISQIQNSLGLQQFSPPEQQQGGQLRFFWDDEDETVQMQQIEQLLYSANSKKDVDLQDLSFT